MGKILIQEIAQVLISKSGLQKKEATDFVNTMFEIIRESLEQDKIVKVKGLGTFKIIDVDSRESVNVNTGERVLIEGHNKITFLPDALMKELVNKPFSQFETVVLNEGVDFADPKDVQEPEHESSEPSQMPLVDFNAEGKDVVDSVDVVENQVVEYVSEPVLEPEPEPEPELEPELEPEPVTEPVTEPVLEPEPEPMVESEPEPEPMVEPTSEPEPEPAPVALSEPVSEPEPVEVSQPAPEPKAEPEPESEDDVPSERNRGRLLPVIACLVGLLIGYVVGNYIPFRNHTKFVVTDNVANSSKPVAKVEPSVKAPVDTVKNQPDQDSLDKVKPAEDQAGAKQPNPAPVVEPAAPATPVTSEVKLDKYEQMDNRVRTGAYRIIGTDYVEKVRPGDDLARISRRTLGKDMECYIEVYNGLNKSSELKVGQEIKIPKLEWKKKKNVQK